MILSGKMSAKIFGPNAYQEFTRLEIEHDCRDFWDKFTRHCGMDRPRKQTDFGVIGAFAWCGNIYNTEQIKPQLDERELFLGNFESGRKAIHLPDVVKLEKPIKFRGSQGTFNFTVPRELHRLVLSIAEKHNAV